MANPIYRSAYTAQQIEDSIGKSPIISADNEWKIWDISTSAYVGTGIYAGVNTPYVVTDAADMTNTGSLYIYLGADSGIYLNGHWYYYDGASWADGGVYQAAGADADFSLTSANPIQNKTITNVFAKYFNSSMNYNEGQYVLYNDLLYVAVNDHHGAWDDDDFSAVKMGTEVSRRAKLTVVGSTFDSGTDYDVGDYVIHRGVLYKFHTAHAAGNSWDSTEVYIVRIMEEVWGKANASDVAAALATKQDTLTFDDAPTDGSTNPVKSDGIYDALATKANSSDMATALATKADIDGTYEDLTAGNAEQLVSSIMEEDKAPYLFRTAGGSADIGNREYDTLVGGTVAWNQIVPETSKIFNGGNTTFSNGIFTVTYEFTSEPDVDLTGTINCVANHKYLICKRRLSGSLGAFINRQNPWGNVMGASVSSKIYSYTANSRLNLHYYGPTASGTSTFKLIVSDLTAMFGSAIADYIASLDNGTNGAGLEWLQSYGFFTEEYYPNNAGSLLSVNATSHDTVGFNAYNPSTGTAVLLGGNEYQITGAYTALSYSTGETITPDADGLFTPSANGTLTITGGDSTTTCVHLTWSGYRNGEYEPYVKHSYPLDSSLTLRGIPKLDENNELYYDGDTYEADGTVIHKYGYVDLSTLTWTIHSGTTVFIGTKDDLNARPIDDSYTVPDILCEKYAPSYTAFLSQRPNEISIDVSGQVRCNTGDASITPTGYLLYPLAAPITGLADPFQSPQIVDDFGTEEYVVTEQSGVSVPVGHTTKYPQNLRDKLQHLPDLAENDGDYLIRQTDSDMELVAYTAPRGVPDAPTTDGTYVLKAVVSGGTATYQWVSE